MNQNVIDTLKECFTQRLPVDLFVHEKIVRLYKSDFTKYETRYKLKLQEIYDAMPRQLDQKINGSRSIV